MAIDLAEKAPVILTMADWVDISSCLEFVARKQDEEGAREYRKMRDAIEIQIGVRAPEGS